ncbi:ATP-dependent Clp protease ATP-binding subunit [Candidatus Uhrbacteria bacterium]|nr:ATP-dependent Clp protease ATP-binding subunit [Candidatus Uhrbacteria bacterium]
MDILDKFTQHLKDCLARSFSLAAEMGDPEINPEHLVLSLLLLRGSVGGELLRKANLSPEEVRRMLRLANDLALRADPERAGTKMPDSGPRLSDESKRTIEKAVLTANTRGHRYVGTEHLLSGLLQIDSPAVEAILTDQDVSASSLREETETVLKGASRFPEITGSQVSGQERETAPDKKDETLGDDVPDGRREGKGANALEFFAVELTDEKAQKKIDPVIGRDGEIERMVQILCRRTKNNPVLLGEPGVGKTAIVEGLAKRIFEGNVPDILRGKRIFSLDLGLMVAGTIYRGEFEGRVKQVVDEVKADADIIVFIDELHNITGAGSTNGSMDLANILKPALARGDLRCIGATTIAEYKKSIESDGALERRFQPIEVKQPSPEATIGILKGLRPHYERWHGVKISDEAIEAAVTLSDRYLTDRFLPDKAIDLIDEASACLRVRDSRTEGKSRDSDIEKRMRELASQKQRLVAAENFIEALKLKARERELSEMREDGGSTEKEGQKACIGTIGRPEVAAVISRATGIPLSDLVREERQRALELESLIGKRIIGQDETVTAIAEMVRRAKSGISDPDRPLASFLFVGPSGVGKTELAKVLAETVFSDPEALIRLDMSEFAEGFNISKLIGAPAGYVGYRDRTKLTDAIKRKPHAVVLFDEIEKAHDEVLNLLLQVLEDGVLTDATGRQVNFRNSIIIMTSNAGSGQLIREDIGFSPKVDGEISRQDTEDAKASVLREMEGQFRPEFLNRIDRIAVFQPLSGKDLDRIARLQLGELTDRIGKDYGIRISFAQKVSETIAERSWDPRYGARNIRRQIQEMVETPLAKELLNEKFRRGDRVTAGIRDGHLSLSRQRTHAKPKA